MSEIFGSDAYAPKQIAERVQSVGVAKTRLPLLAQFTLGILAGGFIGLGALYFMVVVSDPSLGFATTRLLGGLAFSLGLILVVVAGAELFTGNNLQVMAWAGGRITTVELLRSWLVIYVGNFYRRAWPGIISFLVAALAHERRRSRNHRRTNCHR